MMVRSFVCSQDAEGGLYDGLHINFTSHVSRPLLDQLAGGEFVLDPLLLFRACKVVSIDRRESPTIHSIKMS